MEGLKTIAEPSGFTCPDCGGSLFEMKQGRPPRFMCHTGHAFSLRSLAWVQGAVTDEAMWSGLRALQEKEAILRRLATTQSGPEAAASLKEADELARFIESMRTAVASAPPSSSGPGNV